MAASPIQAKKYMWNSALTQGLYHTDHNNIYGQSERDISFDFTEGSINASHFFPYGLNFNGQVIYRHGGATYDGINLDYFNLDYQFLSENNYLSGITLGLFKVDHGLFNESRGVAFTRPSINLSQSVYSDVFLRDTLISANGISAYTNKSFDKSLLTLKIQYGKLSDMDLQNFDSLPGRKDIGGGGSPFKVIYS